MHNYSYIRQRVIDTNEDKCCPICGAAYSSNKKYNDYNKDIEELKKLKIDRMKVSMQNGTYTDIDKSAREIELQEKLKSRNNKSKEYAESGFTARERKRYTNRKNRGTTWAKVIAVTIVIYFVCLILFSFMSNVRF